MKITIWIRPADEGRTTTLRLDAKYENHDTPFIQRMGRKLMDAIEGVTDKAQVCGNDNGNDNNDKQERNA